LRYFTNSWGNWFLRCNNNWSTQYPKDLSKNRQAYRRNLCAFIRSARCSFSLIALAGLRDMRRVNNIRVTFVRTV